MTKRFSCVVLAGERPGRSDSSRELGLPASVLVDVAGKSALARVIEALEASESVESGILCGPAENVYRENPEFQQILESSSFRWMAPETGPSASALAGIEQHQHAGGWRNQPSPASVTRGRAVLRQWEILQFANACWSLLTPASVTRVLWSSNSLRLVNPTRCSSPASLNRRP